MEGVPVQGFPGQLDVVSLDPFCVTPVAPENVSGNVPDTQFGEKIAPTNAI